MLNAGNISVFYNKSQALWDVSFTIGEKEIVVILGSNGAGKSTILNTVAGLIHPSSGTIEFLGQRIDKLPAHRIVSLSVSLVPEGGAYFPTMSLAENLELGGYTRKSKEEKKETLNYIYDIFPVLQRKSQKLASTLSGGERQMLAIARSLMTRPKLFMLDEPSYGLAPLMVAETFRVIGRLRETGTTILVVEQSSKHALNVGDRGYLLENGRIVFEETCVNFKQNDHIKKSYLGL